MDKTTRRGQRADCGRSLCIQRLASEVEWILQFSEVERPGINVLSADGKLSGPVSHQTVHLAWLFHLLHRALPFLLSLFHLLRCSGFNDILFVMFTSTREPDDLSRTGRNLRVQPHMLAIGEHEIIELNPDLMDRRKVSVQNSKGSLLRRYAFDIRDLAVHFGADRDNQLINSIDR